MLKNLYKNRCYQMFFRYSFVKFRGAIGCVLLLPLLVISQTYDTSSEYLVLRRIIADTSISVIKINSFNSGLMTAQGIVNLKQNTYCTRDLDFRKMRKLKYIESCDTLSQTDLYQTLFNIYCDTLLVANGLSAEIRKKYNRNCALEYVIESRKYPASVLDTDSNCFFYDKLDRLDSIVVYVNSIHKAWFINDQLISSKDVVEGRTVFKYLNDTEIISSISRYLILHSGVVLALDQYQLDYATNKVVMREVLSGELEITIDYY